MKRLTLVIALILAVSAAVTAETVTLAEFNSEEYEGWVYTRDGVLINTDNILGRKINLFHSKTNGDHTLVSPLFALSQIDTLTVELSTFSQGGLQENFDLEQASPTIELLNADNEVEAAVKYYFEQPKLSRKFTVTLEVPANLAKGRIRVAAWNADVSCPLSILEVTVTGNKPQQQSSQNGDVNGDGSVNAGDVSAVYNVMLGSTTDSAVIARSDVNIDGAVNAGDVSAVYNIMLK